MADNNPEPWLRGPLHGVDPLLAPVLHALMQVEEDLEKYTAGLTSEQVWSEASGVGTLGFHLKHIAGSLDRLTTYLEGCELSETQMKFLQGEHEPADMPELMDIVRQSIRRTATSVRGLSRESLLAPRYVGRKRLPTTTIGLAIHIAEHTQRHLGEAIVLAKLIRR